MRTVLAAGKSWISRFAASPWCAPVCLLALSAALYGNTVPGGFVYDDVLVTSNQGLRSFSTLFTAWLEPSLKNMEQFPHYRPLTYVSFALNFLLGGESPAGFHLVSILLNGITAWLVFLLTRLLFGNRLLAWIAAIMFSLLPVHTEAVAYIKARDEILVAIFGLLAWLAFLRATDARRPRSAAFGILSAFLSLGAFLSKESAVVLPAVFGGVLLLQHGYAGILRAWKPLAFQAAALAAFFGLYQIAVGGWPVPDREFLYFGQNPLGYMDPGYVPWTAAMLFFLAVAITVVPWNLSATYGFAHLPPINTPAGSWMAVPGLALLCVFVVLILHPRTRRTPLGVGALVFLMLYLPFSKILFHHGIDYFAERWLYAPSIGLSIMGADLLLQARKRQRALGAGLAAVIAGAYILVLVPRNLAWRNQTALGESMLRSAPGSVTTYNLLAKDRLEHGRTEEAWDLVGKGLEITRDHIPLHQTAATIALDMERVDLADQAVSAIEALGGDDLYTAILRSMVLAKQGRFQESLDHLVGCRAFNPLGPRTRFLLALNLWRLGRTDEALPYFDWDAQLPGAKLGMESKIWIIENF